MLKISTRTLGRSAHEATGSACSVRGADSARWVRPCWTVGSIRASLNSDGAGVLPSDPNISTVNDATVGTLNDGDSLHSGDQLTVILTLLAGAGAPCVHGRDGCADRR